MIETNISSAVVPLSDGGIYIIEVRAFSEGGEGTASSQIRVPVSSGERVQYCDSAALSSNVFIFKPQNTGIVFTDNITLKRLTCNVTVHININRPLLISHKSPCVKSGVSLHLI